MLNSGEADSASGERTEAWGRLEDTVQRALGELRALRTRLRDAEERARMMEELFTEEGHAPPARELVDRLRGLEAENRELRRRLAEGREAVDRILARVRFLEEHR